MITREEIQQNVFEVFEDLFEVSPDKLKLESHLYIDLDLDSLDAIDLASALSKKSGLRLVEEEMREIRTIGDIVEIGFKKLNEEKSE
jgi:acyl carrier protein